MAAELTMNTMFHGVEITGNDPRMRFRNSQDPIYVAYEYVDSQPLSKLAQSFVKDKINGVIKFISQINKESDIIIDIINSLTLSQIFNLRKL